MKKPYRVKMYFRTNVDVVVDADNEKDAIDIAATRLGEQKYIQQMLDRMQEDSSPDVEELDFDDVRVTREQGRELGYWD